MNSDIFFNQDSYPGFFINFQTGSVYLVNYLRNKYPLTLNVEQEKELIIKYQTTNDPETSEQISEQILGSIILFIWKTVRKVLFRSVHYDPNLADDLLQEAIMDIKNALKSYDTSRPERFLTYFGKNLESSLIESLYKQISVVRIPRNSNGKLPISIHAESENGTTLEDFLTDPEILSIEQQINQDEKARKLHEDLATILPSLKTEVERRILKGLLTDFDETEWDELRQEHSINKSQLQTKQRKVLRILNHRLDSSTF